MRYWFSDYLFFDYEPVKNPPQWMIKEKIMVWLYESYWSHSAHTSVCIFSILTSNLALQYTVLEAKMAWLLLIVSGSNQVVA